MRRVTLFLLLSVAVLVFLTLYHLVFLTDKNFHLIFCDVGQGDGIFIKTPKGHDIIIDGGPEEFGMTDCLSRHLPFYDREIDAIYMTHPDADHLTGLIQVLRTYNVKYFGTSKAPKETEVFNELMAHLKEKNIPVDYVFRGDKAVTSDGVALNSLWPTTEFLNSKSDDTNDYSLVHLVKFGNLNALLTGDLGSVYLNSIMPTLGRIDIFKPPHHGSKTGVDEFTFQHNVPKLAVISLGAKNKYGHPAPFVLEILSQNKIPVIDTRKGDIEIISDGVKWWVKWWVK